MPTPIKDPTARLAASWHVQGARHVNRALAGLLVSTFLLHHTLRYIASGVVPLWVTGPLALGVICWQNRNLQRVADARPGIDTFATWLNLAAIFGGTSSVLLPPDCRTLSAPFGAALAGFSLAIEGPILTLALGAILFPLFLLVAFWGGYERQFGLPAIDTYQAIFQADWSEASEYVGQVLTTNLVLLAAAPAVLTLSLKLLSPKLDSVVEAGRRRRRMLVAAAICIASLGVIATSRVAEPVLKRARTFQESLEEFQKEVAKQHKVRRRGEDVLVPAGLPAGLPAAASRGNVIFILGESTTRRHMRIYGYHRDTTPRLDALKSELLVHTDTISPHSHTKPSVIEIMTGANYQDNWPPSLEQRPNLIALLSGSGVKTFWFSNQNEYGAWDNPVSLIAKHADAWRFHRKSSGISYRAGFYDETLVRWLEQAISDPAPRKFFVLNLYAAHAKYCDNVPEQQRLLRAEEGLGPKFFGTATDRSATTNCYDNAIRYIDGLIAEAIAIAQRSSAPTSLVFAPDHGENPTNATAHNSARHSAYHVEIPHIWYFNAGAKAEHGDKIEALRRHLHEPFKSSDLYDTLLHLVGVEPKYYRPDRSLFSKSYVSKRRFTLPRRDRYVSYDDLSTPDQTDYLERARVNLRRLRRENSGAWSRLWAHRVNTLGKLQESKSLFAGIETDLVFDPALNRFRVYHPSQSGASELVLDELLEAAFDRPELGLWFVWKNAQPDHFTSALDELARLDRIFAIRKRVIIETGSDALFADLTALRQQGFQHAYYLPTEDIIGCSAQVHKATAACAALAHELHRRSQLVGATTLSYDRRAEAFVEAFPFLRGTYERIARSPEKDASTIEFLEDLPAIDAFKAFLVSFPSIFSS